MGAATGQDFETYQGNSIVPIFTVVNGDGVALDISNVNAIEWNARRQVGDVVLTKTKAAGGITFVTDGTDGKFQVAITAVDTAALSGRYLHEATVTDSLNNVTTVAIGYMGVGLSPGWTYDPSQLDSTPLFQVRFLCGDTLSGDQQLADAEIQFAITTYSNVYLAAAEACRAIAAKYARKVDITQGEMRTAYAQQFKAYSAKAIELEQRGNARAGFVVFAGGISQSQKQAEVANTDRVPPQFNIGMSDNMNMPISPVNTQVPSGAPGMNSGPGVS